MATHLGGETVSAGFYMSVSEWNVETMSGDGGVLPGTAETVYRSVPTIVLLLAAPLLGAAFAMFLPFIGLALVAQLLREAGVVVHARHGARDAGGDEPAHGDGRSPSDR